MIDRGKLVKDIDKVTDTCLEMLDKDKLEASDFSKLKIVKSMASFVNAKVAMVQQESAMERISLIKERMKQLGYETKPALMG